MNRKQKNMLGIGVVAVSIIYLSALSFSNALSFYYEVGEFVEKARLTFINGTFQANQVITKCP